MFSRFYQQNNISVIGKKKEFQVVRTIIDIINVGALIQSPVVHLMCMRTNPKYESLSELFVYDQPNRIQTTH